MTLLLVLALVAAVPGSAAEHRCLSATAAPSLPATLGAQIAATSPGTACGKGEQRVTAGIKRAPVDRLHGTTFEECSTHPGVALCGVESAKCGKRLRDG